MKGALMPTPLPEGEAQALRHCLTILARHATPAERRNMASNTDKRISGQDTSTLVYTYRHLSALFFPTDDERARHLEETMRAAREANTLTSVMPPDHGRITLSDLAIWPDCPHLPANSPLRYWLPAIPVETSEHLPAPLRAHGHQVAPRMLRLVAGTEYVKFGDLAHLIADALWPEDVDPARWSYAVARVNLDNELAGAVRSGQLPVKDPSTRGPCQFTIGAALAAALVGVDDLRSFVHDRGLKLEFVGDDLRLRRPRIDTSGNEMGTREDLLALLGAQDFAKKFPHHRDTTRGLFLKTDVELIKDDALRLEHDGHEFNSEEARLLMWTPGPRDEPAIPFPFSIAQLGAFMVYGAGHDIAGMWTTEAVAEKLEKAGSKATRAFRMLAGAHRLLEDAEALFPSETKPEGSAAFSWSVLQRRADWLRCGALEPKLSDGEQSVIDWHDATLHANTFLEQRTVTPEQAAMLLVAQNPLAQDALRKARGNLYLTEDSRPEEGRAFELLLLVFTDAQEHTGERNLLGYLELAKQRGLTYDPWLDEYMAQASMVAQREELEARMKRTASQATPTAEIDPTALATRQQLIAAFGTFTGMCMAWFEKLADTPALLNARKVKGQGQRGRNVEPLFCPAEVMYWLMDKKRKKGKPFHSAGKPWELLQKYFPEAYDKHSMNDPREQGPG
jgi:hypothetical protein